MNKTKQLIKLKKKAFSLWSKRIREKNYCELCERKYKEPNPNGKPTILQAHHIIGRENKRLAWDLKNGICLCDYCHKWSRVGPHRGSIIFNEWYRMKYPENYKYLLSCWEEDFELTIENMEKIIKSLI